MVASASLQPAGWAPGKAIARGEGGSSRSQEAQARRLRSLTPSAFSGLEQPSTREGEQSPPHDAGVTRPTCTHVRRRRAMHGDAVFENTWGWANAFCI